MKIKKGNTKIGAISIIIGVILIFYTLPLVLSLYAYSTYAFLYYYTYIILDLFALGITMLIYAYFLIKPTRTLKGNQNLAISAMVFGLVLVILPMIGIGLQIYDMTSYGYFSSYMIMYVMPLLVMLIPGVALLLHGRFLRKKPRTEELKKMEIKKGNTKIGAISIIIGVILIFYTLPWLTSPYGVFSTNAFLNYYTYIYLDLFVLAITIFIYAYFLIKPTRTLKGKQNLAISAMVFGLVLVILPMIGIGVQIYSMTSYGYFSSYMIIYVMPLIVMLIPGVALLIHGWFLRKKLRTEEAKDVGPEELVVLSSPEEMISKRELKKMEIKERNTIIGAISIIIGVILIFYTLPWLTSPYGFFSTNAFLYSYNYLYLDFFVLAITMFIYAYFLIKPTRTLKGKQNLAISAMVFGLVLVILPMIAYFFVMVIPGVALLLHGRSLRKKLRTEEAKDVVIPEKMPIEEEVIKEGVVIPPEKYLKRKRL